MPALIKKSCNDNGVPARISRDRGTVNGSRADGALAGSPAAGVRCGQLCACEGNADDAGHATSAVVAANARLILRRFRSCFSTRRPQTEERNGISRANAEPRLATPRAAVALTMVSG
jgi:hypothetical protein